MMMVLMVPSAFSFNNFNNVRQADTVKEVYAQPINDNEVKVVWSWDKIEHRDAYQYNVYKRNVLFDSESVLVAENVTDTVIIDNTWGDDAVGVYQWGVEVVDNNSVDDRSEILNIDFEDGVMPEGWVTTSEQVYPTTSEWSVATGLAYVNFPAHGQYSAFSNGTGIDGSLHYNMITSAINLKHAESATLSFDYANVEFLGVVCVLNVKVGTSQDGPWETVFTIGENQDTWTSASVSLSDYVGQTIYIAFENKDFGGMGIGVDNIVLNTTEPTIVWSNALEKDMITSVEVKVISNSTESLSGTTVSFVNVNEIGNDYEVELDETAYYKWNDFRKGIYKYTVSKKGYNSDATGQSIEILDETSLECVLTEIIHAAEFLRVSPTGLATWEGEEINSRSIESYTVLLNGVEEATVTDLHYRHEDVTAGETYTTTVIANFASGSSDPVEYTWTAVACDEYEGVSDLAVKYISGDEALLTWTLPVEAIGALVYRDGELLTDEILNDEAYSDPLTAAGTFNYCVEAVYEDYVTSCLQCEEFEYDGVSVKDNDANAMRIYPNPVKDNLTITAEAMTRITITNTLGQVMYDEEVVSDNQEVNVSQYKAGVYVVRIATETGVIVERVVVNN